MRQINRLYSVYDKNRTVMENIVFPALLLVYPLLKARRGIDVSDAAYSLANFQYFTSMDGTWAVATYLANAAGRLLMCLPFGDTLIGMYCYTLPVQSAAALAVYGVLKKEMPAPLVFAGEVIALGLCWCPSTVLYNYLTYLLMTAGVLLLREGILRGYGKAVSGGAPPGGRPQKYYVMAGICLGANVAVRMPNVVQAAFIVAVWYGAFLGGSKDKWKRMLGDTAWCILGYAIGFGIPFGTICIRYGIHAYPAMVQGMFAMTEKAVDYKPAAMLTGMLGDYFTGLYWLAYAAACVGAGWLLFMARRRFFAGSRLAAALCGTVYGAVFIVLLRFYWGKGVFTFQYYNYRSMYYPAVLFLTVAVFMAAACLCGKNMPAGCRVTALLVLVQILVTPLGSNNRLYPIINNMFVTAPFVLWMGYLWGAGKRQKPFAAVWATPFLLLVSFVLAQSVGFHLRFSFQDGIWGEERDTVATLPEKAAGVYTTQDNAAWLSELAAYTKEAGLTGKEVLLYGDIPGLGYLLDMPSALSTFWPDLDSYRMAEYERDMAQMAGRPVIITSAPIAAYLNEDADGMNWFGVDREALEADGKLQILGRYMEENSYRESFGNGRYVVYVTEG